MLDEGAARVYAAATHPVSRGNAYENLAAVGLRADRRHRHDPAARPARPTTSACSRCADLLTDSIRRIFTDDSVSEVFGGENQLF